MVTLLLWNSRDSFLFLRFLSLKLRRQRRFCLKKVSEYINSFGMKEVVRLRLNFTNVLLTNQGESFWYFES